MVHARPHSYTIEVCSCRRGAVLSRCANRACEAAARGLQDGRGQNSRSWRMPLRGGCQKKSLSNHPPAERMGYGGDGRQ
jgi:hypothetical protein